MRISTQSFYNTSTNQLNNLQSALARTQMQLSTDRRLLTPADDPVASARALEVTQSQNINAQFATNRSSAKSSMAHVESALQNAGDLLQEIQELAVEAGNGIMLPADREKLATELEGRLTDLLGVANTSDGVGGYLFSGFKTTTQPFTATANGAAYQGDSGVRQLQVSDSRKVPLSASGSTVFESIPTGNGVFTTKADATNKGAAIISSGSVVNRPGLDNTKYEIEFGMSADTPPVPTYSVYNTSNDPRTVLPDQQDLPYKEGQQISFGGMAMDIKGVPAAGDKFSVEPSQKQSVFTTVTDLIKTLRSPTDGSTGKAALTNQLNSAIDNLKNAHDNVLTVQASVGAHMNELDYLDSAGMDLDIQYASTLDDLQGLDTVKAISDFSQQQLTLQAAQMSFKTMSGLSLFNVI
ncbi:flagellar hook-associated protein FlgL [Massilia sp. CFBP9012]|uniref:flagellar hook-associated protein FlgL n=1 Tax=Massilia sp. CFBP9012 TaxID=3096531 RepID=UPI002A69C4B0|nr:flagellar hook-associated protein FlgL [Massilia sp. CFBP9012]MDY0977620.1 flagellar hook-associated protein FlgL [Massilia sp. CFBP9012]